MVQVRPSLVLSPILLVILVLMAVGLVVLLSKRRRAGLALLGTGMLLFLALFFVGVSRTNVRVLQQSQNRVRSELPSTSTTPAIWLDDIEDEFRADVYPSMRSAAKALGRELGPLLPEVVADNQIPAIVQVCGQVEPDKISHEVLNALGDTLREHNESMKVIVETIIPGTPIARTNPNAVTVEVSLARWSHRARSSHNGYSQSLQVLASGTLRAHIQGAASQLTRTVEFVKKPWVENFAGFRNRNPQRQFLLARSQDSCSTEADAEQQAMSNACRQIAQLLDQIRKSNVVPQSGFTVNPPDLHSGHFISDRFVQSFEGTAGRIWRHALLLDVSQDKLNRLAGVKFGQMRSLRASWAHMIISIIGLTVLICVVYFFLDAATRGYYTLALRVAAAVLIAAAIVVILFLS